MRRGPPGKYEKVWYGSGHAKALRPDALPPHPPIVWSEELARQSDECLLALGSLNTTPVPDDTLDLGQLLLQREVILGLACTGARLSLEDLLMHEAGLPPPNLDQYTLKRAHNALAAFEVGFEGIAGGVPPTTRLLRRANESLAAEGRPRKYGGPGHYGVPGEYRQKWLWLGMLNRVSRPNMRPLPEHVPHCMAELDTFLTGNSYAATSLLRAALSHAQLDLIYPFADDGARTNLLFTALQLRYAGLMCGPTVQLSEVVRDHRPAYLKALEAVRLDGNWEQWVGFFVQALSAAASRTQELVSTVVGKATADRRYLAAMGYAGRSRLAVLQALEAKFVASGLELQRVTGMPSSTLYRALRTLQGLGSARELTGKERNRVYRYEPVVQLLSANTAQPGYGPSLIPHVV